MINQCFLAGILVESVEDYQSLCDLARCGRELWGLETVVMTHGPRANPGQIEDPWSRRCFLCHTWRIILMTWITWLIAMVSFR